MTQTVPDTSTQVKEALSLVSEDHSLFEVFQRASFKSSQQYSPTFSQQLSPAAHFIPSASPMLTSLSSETSSTTPSPVVPGISPVFPVNQLGDFDHSSSLNQTCSMQFNNHTYNKYDDSVTRHYEGTENRSFSYDMEYDIKREKFDFKYPSWQHNDETFQNNIGSYNQSNFNPYPESQTVMSRDAASTRFHDDKRVLIPADPQVWRPLHVTSWLRWVIKEYGLHHIEMSRFSLVDGDKLCGMSVDDLTKYTTRYNSEVLIRHLKFLKQAAIHQLPAIKSEKQRTTNTPLTVEDYKTIYRGAECGDTEKMTIEETYHLLGPLCTRLCKQGGGQIQLWQFLLKLLSDQINAVCITWEGTNGEFKMVDPDEVARRWGERKSKPNMNYDKMSRALRYYYDKNILTKVHGKRYAYRFDFQGLAQAIQVSHTSDRYGYTYTQEACLPSYSESLQPRSNYEEFEGYSTSSSTFSSPWHEQTASPEDSYNKNSSFTPNYTQQSNHRNQQGPCNQDSWRDTPTTTTDNYSFHNSSNCLDTTQTYHNFSVSNISGARGCGVHYAANTYSYARAPPSTDFNYANADKISQDLTHSQFHFSSSKDKLPNKFAHENFSSPYSTSPMTSQEMTSSIGGYSCSRESNYYWTRENQKDAYKHQFASPCIQSNTYF